MKTMKPDPRFLDDLARVAGGAVNVFSGLQQQIRDEMRSRFEDMASHMDLVPREDFDQLAAMTGKLRQKIDALEKRLEKLEDKKAPTAKKPAPKINKKKARRR